MDSIIDQIKEQILQQDKLIAGIKKQITDLIEDDGELNRNYKAYFLPLSKLVKLLVETSMKAPIMTPIPFTDEISL